MIDRIELGQKIKVFRVRAGLSQFQLELEIDASNGSISRIESGKINPTKETLFKISECLKLTPEETAQLFGIELSSTQDLIENYEQIKKDFKEKESDPYSFLEYINLTDTLDKILKEAEDLGYKSPAIYIREPNSEIYQLARSNASQESFELAKELLGKDIYEIEYTLGDQTLPTHAILSGELQTSKNTFELLFPHLGRIYSLQSKKDIKQVLAVPLKINSQTIGCITFLSVNPHLKNENVENLEYFAQAASKSVYTAIIKDGIDSKISNNIDTTMKELKIQHNFKSFLPLKELMFLLKNDKYMRIMITLFTTFSLYWLINQIFLTKENIVYQMFGHIYFIMAVFAASIGLKVLKVIGGYKNTLQRMIFLLILITICHIFGQVYNALFTYFTGLDLIYPSLSDIGFLSATILSLFLSLYIYKYVRNKTYQTPFNKKNLLSIIITSGILYYFQYTVSFGIYDWEQVNFLTILFDISYGLGQSLVVVISMLSLIVIRSTIISKEVMLFLKLYFYASILLYIADLTFTYKYTYGNYVVGEYPDFLYFVYYSLISFGHVLLYATIQKNIQIEKNRTEINNYDYVINSVVERLTH